MSLCAFAQLLFFILHAVGPKGFRLRIVFLKPRLNDTLMTPHCVGQPARTSRHYELRYVDVRPVASRQSKDSGNERDFSMPMPMCGRCNSL